MSKFIFVTGGVVSSLGKGISAASIGKLLQSHGLSVTMVKCDPYINVDAGTMNPFQHGEVFVTEDGAETDLDLGYYERFLGINMRRENNITAGSVYESVISKERTGKYLGSTVQVIPHITDEIKSRFYSIAKKYDVTIIEIGGTVGDIESLPFLEAARQMRPDRTRCDSIYIHVTLVPYLSSSDEVKTKPTQHSVNKLREIGIDPDIIICRTEKSLGKEIRAKIALFCSVPEAAVIEAPNVPSIYDVPMLLNGQGIDEQIMMLLRIRSTKRDFSEWTAFSGKSRSLTGSVTVALAGKYTSFKDSYRSVVEALHHGGLANNTQVRVDFVDVEDGSSADRLLAADGILVPGGFGERGVEGKINAVRLARENNIPFFGICLGMQCAVIEAARSLLGLKAANSSEFSPRAAHPVIDIMAAQRGLRDKGGTMRLGDYPCSIKGSGIARKAYQRALVKERHRHRYEFNSKYRKAFERKGLIVTGMYREQNLPEIVELKSHPWFVGVQFHPEFKSRPLAPHPLFASFIGACVKRGARAPADCT